MARRMGLRPKLPSNLSSCCLEGMDRPPDDSASPFQPSPTRSTLLHFLGTAVTRDLPTQSHQARRPQACASPPGPQAFLRAFGFLRCSRLLLPSHPQHPIPKSQSLGPLAWELSDQQDLGPPLAHSTRQGGQATGDGQREFSTNLFFFRLRSFDSPAPQKSCHLPPPPPPAPPPPLLLAITHGDLTTSAPLALHSCGPWVIG
ncbi:unnamed protein product [Gulo gulo]|uniref:Uncharacterized protein n=1 Tax=Gulo gulo TaxID=48420 RepID=A0A9X9LQ58_GULGU|nr:unnamed protein product [Gulo gulo]